MHPSQKNVPRVFGLSTESLKTLAAKNPFYQSIYNAAKNAPLKLAFARRVVREMQISNIFRSKK